MACNQRNQHSAISFFKIITTTSLEAGKLKIPNGFTRKYGGDMSNPMSIKPPDGTKWEIHWTKHDSDIWFQKGWKEFVKYYSLDHGHLVLFEYKDASHFGVHIFDKSTLEIEYPSHENQDEEHNPDQIDDDSVEILDEIPQCKKTKRKSPISCPQPCKKLRTRTSEDVGRRPKLRKFPKQCLVEGNQSRGTNFEKSTLEPVHNELDDDAGGATECLKGEHLTSKTTKPLKRAGTLIFGNSFFTITMKPYNVDGCALVAKFSNIIKVKIQHIPSQFAKKHFKKKREILLQVLDGRTWSVSYNLCKFCAGWKKFALDNKLKVGDVCRFELNKRGGRKLKLKVLIFPVAEEQHSPRSQEHAGGTTECLKGEPLTSKTTEALNRAGTPGSKNAFFTVMMKPYSVYDRCLVKIQRIPSHFANKYLKKKSDILLQVLDGRTWSVCYNLYKFSGGWKEFVLDNKLKVGDVCRFELNQSGGLSLKLKVLIFPAAEEPHSPRSQEKQSEPSLNSCQTTRGKAGQRNGALEEANKFTSKNPFFTVTIQPGRQGDIYRPLVTMSFMKKHLNKKEIVMLQFGSNLCPVKLLHYTHSSNGAKLSRGWALFARVSKLVAGDVCVFELINKKDAVFDVHIYRGN